MDLKDIKAIIDLMKKNAISEFELEKQEFKIKLKRGGNGIHQYDEPGHYPMQIAPQVVSPSAGPAAATVVSPAPSNEFDIRSPMVGTFYRSPSPEASSYIEIGAEVNPDTVVCIIEAMKVMNEIKGEARGIVTQILCENGKPVEFGQPLFKMRPI